MILILMNLSLNNNYKMLKKILKIKAKLIIIKKIIFLITLIKIQYKVYLYKIQINLKTSKKKFKKIMSRIVICFNNLQIK